MVKKIRWSARAYKDKLEILNYWINRNKSNTYSIKLDRLFDESIELLAEIPELGKSTDFSTVRIKIIRDYLIYYRIGSDHIEIAALWDSRRNPKKFKL